MKLFTRCFFLLAVLLLPLASAFATTFTVTIGNNFYAPVALPSLLVGDQVTFVWQAGFHPTQSDSPTAAWPTFTLSASNPSITLPPFTTAGVYPYHCQAHGTPTSGQRGTITVNRVGTATLDPRLAAAINIYPNPSHGQVTVQLTQKLGTDYKLRLSNIIGQDVRTVALKPELTTAGLPLDLSELPAGVYFYSLVVDGKAITTKRLVLQN